MKNKDKKQIIASLNSNRIYFLDNLKSFLIILVVLGHSAFAYTTTMPERWSINPEKNIIFDIFVLFGHVFFMISFFAISGYFSFFSIKKYQVKTFLKKRFIRLGIPLVIGIIFLNPIISYVRQLSINQSTPNYFQYWIHIYIFKKFDTEHLWFLVTLIILSVLISIIVFIKKDIFKNSFLKKPSTHFLGTLIIFATINGLLFFLVNLLTSDKTYVFFGSIQPTRFVLYTGFFFMGAYFFKHGRSFINTKTNNTFFWLISVIILSVVFLLFYSIFKEIENSIFLMLIRGMIWSFLGLIIFIFLIKLFYEKFNRPSRIGQKISRNVYPIYIFHLPFVVALQYTLVNVPLSLFIKFSIVSFISFSISFLIGEFIICRFSVIKKYFNMG